MDRPAVGSAYPKGHLTPALEAFQGRLANCIAALRLVEAKHPGVRQQTGEVIGELQRLHRDIAGLPPLERQESPPPVVQRASRAPGVRQMTPKQRCPAHYGGQGAMVAPSRFRPGKAVCRECERREVRLAVDSVTVELLEGDKCVGHDCPGCGLPFEIGDRLKGLDLHHEACAS